MPTDPSDDASFAQPTDSGSKPEHPPKTVTTYQQSLDGSVGRDLPGQRSDLAERLAGARGARVHSRDSVDWALRSHEPAPLPLSWAVVLGAFGVVLLSGGGSRSGLVVRAAAERCWALRARRLGPSRRGD